MANINEHESARIDRANASGKPPVVFIHGLWPLPSSWDRWAEVFEAAGFTALAPGSFKRQKRNEGLTEIVQMPERGHSLTIDHGWRAVADTALAFVKRVA